MKILAGCTIYNFQGVHGVERCLDLWGWPGLHACTHVGIGQSWEVNTTWKSRLVSIALFTSVADLVLFVKSTASSNTVAMILELVCPSVLTFFHWRLWDFIKFYLYTSWIHVFGFVKFYLLSMISVVYIMYVFS